MLHYYPHTAESPRPRSPNPDHKVVSNNYYQAFFPKPQRCFTHQIPCFLKEADKTAEWHVTLA